MTTPTLQVLADVAHSLAGEHPGPDRQLWPAATFSRLLFLGAGAGTAGLALLRPLTAAPQRHLARAGTALAVTAGLATIQLDAASPVLITVVVAALLAAHLCLARPRVAAATGALAAILLAAHTAGRYDGDARYAAAIQILAGTVWLGAAAAIGQAPATDRAARATRLAPWTLPPALAVAAAGALLAPAPSGLILIAEAVAAALVATRWRRTTLPGAATAVTLAVVVVAATAAAALPAAPPQITTTTTTVAGQPLLSRVVLAGRPVPVLVVPHRPGWNLVHVGADRAAVGTDPDHLTGATTSPGTAPTWIRIHLPAGPTRLRVAAAGATGEIPLDTGSDGGDRLPGLDGPDGPECASAALGALIAGVTRALTSCPSDTLSSDDADALRAMLRFVAARGNRTVALSSDSSPRGTTAEAEIRATAARTGVTIVRPGTAPVPLVITSGWAAADTVLRDVGAGHTPAQGTYLAPWLLATPLLDHPAGQLLPLRYAPRDLNAVRYAAELGDRFPGEPATAAGYATWLAARHLDTRGPLRLYAASRVYLPGAHGPDPAASGGPHAGHSAASWFPGGTVVAVTGPLTDQPKT